MPSIGVVSKGRDALCGFEGWEGPNHHRGAVTTQHVVVFRTLHTYSLLTDSLSIGVGKELCEGLEMSATASPRPVLVRSIKTSLHAQPDRTVEPAIPSSSSTGSTWTARMFATQISVLEPSCPDVFIIDLFALLELYRRADSLWRPIGTDRRPRSFDVGS